MGRGSAGRSHKHCSSQYNREDALDLASQNNVKSPHLSIQMVIVNLRTASDGTDPRNSNLEVFCYYGVAVERNGAGAVVSTKPRKGFFLLIGWGGR